MNHLSPLGGWNSPVDRPRFVTPGEPAGLSISPGHWWDLNDDGAWADSVGSWDLTEFGTVTISSGGGPNGQDVAVFDATGDYLKLTTAKNPVTEGYDTAFSLSIWAYHTSFNTGYYGNYYSGWRGASGTNFHYDLMYSGTTADCIAFSGPKGTPCFASSVSEATSTWYHVVATWDGSTQKLYVNDDLKDSDANTNTAYNGAINLFVGTTYSGGASNLQMLGRLGMFGLFPGALTADDVTYLYNSGNGRQFGDL